MAALVVLGLSISLQKDQVYGWPPVTTSFGTFTGVWGTMAAVVGMLSLFMDSIANMIPVTLDVLAALYFMAGGIVRASIPDTGSTYLASHV